MYSISVLVFDTSKQGFIYLDFYNNEFKCVPYPLMIYIYRYKKNLFALLEIFWWWKYFEHFIQNRCTCYLLVKKSILNVALIKT